MSFCCLRIFGEFWLDGVFENSGNVMIVDHEERKNSALLTNPLAFSCLSCHQSLEKEIGCSSSNEGLSSSWSRIKLDTKTQTQIKTFNERSI